MPGNIDPVYSRIGRVSNGATTFVVSANTANTNLNGVGTLNTNMWVAFTADATNGSFLRSVVAKCCGTGTGAAFILRLFLNNGTAPNASAADSTTALYRELFIPAITPSASVASPDYEVLCNIMLPPGYRILYTYSAAPGNIWTVYGIGGDY